MTPADANTTEVPVPMGIRDELLGAALLLGRRL